MEERFCFYIDEMMIDKESRQLRPVIVKENVAGYFITDYLWGKDFEQAKSLVNALNARLGLTPREADQIVASSMARQIAESANVCFN